MWRHFAADNRRFALAAGVGTLTMLSNIALLATSAFLIARAAQMPPVLELSIAVVSVRTLALSRAVGRYTERLLSHDATFRSLGAVRAAIYRAIENAAPTGLGSLRRGDALSRAVADVDRLQDLPLRGVLPAASSIVSAGAVSAAAFAFLPAAGAAVAVSLAVAATVAPWAAMRVAAASEAAVAATAGNLTDAILELVEGQADLVMLGASHSALRAVADIDTDLVSASRRLAFGTGAAAAVVGLAQAAALVGSVLAAAHAVAAGSLSPVMSVVVGLLPLAAFETVTGLPSAALAWVSVRSSAARVDELLGVRPASDEPACTGAALGGDLSLESVAARWTRDPAVHDVTMRIVEGRTTALVGPSGGGKSTVLAVLAGLLRPYAGTYKVGGTDTSEVCGQDIRNHVVLSLQDSHIFATTVAENLRLAARPGSAPSDDDLRRAIAAVGLDQWLGSLPRGLDTVIGENGATMSGGQRQRLLAARMLLADPDVWLLDEPTEHLDGDGATALLRALTAAAGGRTVVVASHLARDAMAADTVVDLEPSRGTMGQ